MSQLFTWTQVFSIWVMFSSRGTGLHGTWATLCRSSYSRLREGGVVKRNCNVSIFSCAPKKTLLAVSTSFSQQKHASLARCLRCLPFCDNPGGQDFCWLFLKLIKLIFEKAIWYAEARHLEDIGLWALTTPS